jgi:hypothetical protein
MLCFVFCFSGSLSRVRSVQAEVYEPDFGACGAPGGPTCYLGSAQSSGRVPPLGRPGTGPVSGPAVLALAPPLSSAAEFYYLAGDPRKHLGAYSPAAAEAFGGAAAETLPGGGLLLPGGSASSSSSDAAAAAPPAPDAPPAPPPPALVMSAAAGSATAVDFEACAPLANAAAVRGGVCVAVRGGCPFALKTLHCQAAGAVATLILNNNFAESGAPNSWVISGVDPSAVQIPTLALSAREAQQLLGWMLDPRADVSSGGGATSSPYTRRVDVAARAYACAPADGCAACAPGLAAPADGCSSAACPGMDEAYSVNCTGAMRFSVLCPSALLAFFCC